MKNGGMYVPPLYLYAMSIRLSPRLLSIAKLVPVGAKVIDVGTDHAMIPVWLAQTGLAKQIWASDLRSGPLQNAAKLVRESGTEDRIHLKLTDGLNGFSAEDGNTVIIAGMGGETIVSILSAAPWLKHGVFLILQPQSKQEILRRWLRENSYCILSEQLEKDSGRLYPILTAKQGTAPLYKNAEYYTGLYSQISDDPLFPEYLDLLMKKTKSAAPYDRSAQILLEELKDMKERKSNAYGL